MHALSSLSGRIVLVTGATGGLGPAVVREIAACGAHLAVAGGREASAVALANEIADGRGFGADLTGERGAAELVARVTEHVGEIHALVHLVGGYEGGSLAESDVDVWDRMLALNLRSAILTARAVLPGMVERGHGKIVAVASKAARETTPGSAAYAVSKAALVKLVEVVAAEVRDAGVQVNAVAPSTIDTPANRASMPRADASRWVQPEDVARAIVFLLQSDAVSGTVLEVYGRS
jgi:NAD(P)-dependent dehydrogenase (short-subunit alcohol dehydrogenase family)